MSDTITRNCPKLSRANHKGKLSFLLLYLLVMHIAPASAQDVPVLIKNDILTFTGGSVDALNSDIYTIEMEEFVTHTDEHPSIYYPITIKRPKGENANYPVSVRYEWRIGTMNPSASIVQNVGDMNDYGSTHGGIGILTFEAGEVEKQLYVNFPSEGVLKGTQEAMYLFFSPLTRTMTEQPVLELVFTNPDVPEITGEQIIRDCKVGALNFSYGTDQYIFLKLDYAGENNSSDVKYAELTEEQKLVMKDYAIDHDATAQGVQEANNPDFMHQTTLTPRLIGAVSPCVGFLYKIEESAIVTDYFDEYNGIHSALEYNYSFVTQIKQTNAEETGSIDMSSLSPVAIMVGPDQLYVYPRLGTVEADKRTYDINEVVTLTIPFLNAKLYQKVYGSEWLNHFFITLDGGESFLPNHPTYDAVTGSLKVSFNAPNNTGAATTLYPEIGIRQKSDGDMIYLQGAFTSISVTTATAPTVPATGIVVNGLPENDRVFIGKQPHTVLNYKVTPDNCSYLNATWKSSNEAILKITPSGELVPVSVGEATITLDSDDPNYADQTFVLTVKTLPQIKPVVVTQRKLPYEPITARFTQDVEACGWVLAGESVITITYDDANGNSEPDYETITLNNYDWKDAFDGTDTLVFNVPFHEMNFPRRNSRTNPETSLYVPVCTVDIRVPVKDATGDEVTLTASYPIYILPYVTPRIIGYAETDVVKTRDEQDHRTVKTRFTVENLDKEFTMEVVVFRTTYTAYGDVLEKGSAKQVFRHIFDYPISGKPDWLTLEDMGDTYTGTVEVSMFSDSQTVPPGMYFRYICDLYVKSRNLFGDQASATARSRIHVYNSEVNLEDELNITYSFGGISTPLTQEGWVDNNDAAFLEFNTEIAKGIIPVGEVMSLLGKIEGSRYRVIDQLVFPEYWGTCVLESPQSNGQVLHIEMRPHDFQPIYLQFPKPDTTYVFTFGFPKMGIKQEFKYQWKRPDISNLRMFQIRREAYYPLDVVMKYDTNKTQSLSLKPDDKSIPVMCLLTENDQLLFEFPGNSKYADTEILLSKNKFRTHEVVGRKAEMEMAFRHIDGSWWADSWYKTSGPLYADIAYFLTETATLDVELFDEEGKKIPAGANPRINYMLKHPGRDVFLVAKKNVESNEDGTISLKLLEGTSFSAAYEIYAEIIAEGYTPQVEILQFRSGGASPGRDGFETETINGRTYYSTKQKTKVRLRKGNTDYDKLTLKQIANTEEGLQNKASENIEMRDFSIQSFTPYIPAKYDNEGKITQYSILEVDVIDKVDAPMYWAKLVSSSKPEVLLDCYKTPRYLRSTYTAFENNYYTLSCKLFNEPADGGVVEYFSKAQEMASVYIRNYDAQYTVVKSETKLPGLINADPLPKPVAYEAPGSGKMETKDASEGGNLGGAKNNFNSFNLETLDKLPFCMEITKSGNEWVVRGAIEMDLVSTDFLAPPGNSVNKSNFKEKFKQLKDKMKYGTDDGKTKKSVKVALSIAGYVEGKGTYNPTSGQLENISFSAGGISLTASAEVSLKKTYLVGEFGVALAGAIRTGIDFYKSTAVTETFNVDLVFDNTISLSLKAWGELGFDAWVVGAKLGVVGKASASMTHRLERLATGATRDGLKFNLAASIDLYARGWIGPIEYSWDKTLISISKDFLVPNDDTNPFNKPIGLRSSNSEMRLVSRSFHPISLRSVSPELTPLISGLRPNTDPRYIGPNEGFLYTNVGDPKDYNDDRIQQFKEDTPTNINPDAKTAAYNFDVSSALGHTIMVYEQQNKAIVSTDLDGMDERTVIQTLTPETEVVAAVKVGDRWTSSVLSNNEYANMSPRVAVSTTASSSWAAAVWTTGVMTLIEKSEEVESAKEGEEDVMETSTSTQQYLKGELMMSKYNGTSWSETPRAIAYLDDNFQLAEQQLIMFNDTVLVVGVKQSPSRRSSVGEGEIVTLMVTGDKAPVINSTGKKGRNPQIKRIGEENILTFLAPIPDSQDILYSESDDDTPVDPDAPAKANPLDVYLMAIDNEGFYKKGLSGFVGLSESNIQNYRLVADDGAVGMNNLTLLWHEPSIVYHEDGEGYDAYDKLFAARLGRWNGLLFTSAPVEIVKAPVDHWIASYDALTSGTDLKAVVSIAGAAPGSGAEIVEESVTFSNDIEIVEMSYNKSELMPGVTLPVDFVVANKGYAPITHFEVKIGDEVTPVSAELMPGKSTSLSANYNVPRESVDMAYSILPTFAEDIKLRSSGNDNDLGIRARTSIMRGDAVTTKAVEGSTNVSIIDMAIREVSNKTEEEGSTVLVEVTNLSPFELKSEKVTVGLYTNVFGEEQFPDTEIQTVSLSDLYESVKGEDGSIEKNNSSTFVAFNVPAVTKETLVYAIVSTFNEEGEKIEDVETIDNYAIIHLYPPLAALRITTTALKDGEVGKEYEDTLGYEGEGEVTWSLEDGSSLPDGLSLNESSGIISGTPTATGITTFTVVLTDGTNTVSTELNITVNKLPTILTASLPSGVINVEYETTLQAEEETDLAWSINSGSLPKGLVLNGKTGVISGTPTETGTYDFVVKLTIGELSSTANFSITIYDASVPLTITTTSLPEGMVNEIYNAVLDADGPGPFNWSIFTGSLPGGLTLGEKTGVISGIPLNKGESIFAVELDNNVTSVKKELNITIRDNTTGLDDYSDKENNLKVSRVDNGLLVSGLIPGENIYLYNAQGQLVFHQSDLVSQELFIQIYHHAVYIVVSGNRRVVTIY